MEPCSPCPARPPVGRQSVLNPGPPKALSRGTPSQPLAPAQWFFNMDGNQDPFRRAAKGFRFSTQKSTHKIKFLWTTSQGSVFVW